LAIAQCENARSIGSRNDSWLGSFWPRLPVNLLAIRSCTSRKRRSAIAFSQNGGDDTVISSNTTGCSSMTKIFSTETPTAASSSRSLRRMLNSGLRGGAAPR